MSKAADLANLIGNINAGGGGVNRNIVINGAMQVAQRGTQTDQTSGYTACDRWNFAENGSVVVTTSQSTDVPSGQGFANSLKIDVTTASGTPSSGNYALVRTKFEGQDLQHLLYGTSSAKPLTLSFWVKSPKTGTHIVQLTHSDAGYYNSIAYTVNSANTWEHKSVTFVGYQTTAFDDDNNNSLQVYWWLMKYDEGTLTENTWHNTSANQASDQVNTMDNTSNNFYLTGVQLEVGQNATEFEHEPYAVTKDKCLRYYWRQGGGAVCLGSGTYYSSTNFAMHMDLPVPMRIGPTHGSEFNSSSFIVYSNASADYIEGIGAGRNAANESGECYAVQWDSSGGNGTQGHGGIAITQSSGQYIDLDAEL